MLVATKQTILSYKVVDAFVCSIQTETIMQECACAITTYKKRLGSHRRLAHHKRTATVTIHHARAQVDIGA